jgi:ABC-type transport system substrate-binding protein
MQSKIALLALFTLIIFSSGFSSSLISAGQTTDTCTASNTLHVTMTGGAPNTLASSLTTSSEAAFELTEMQYAGAYPALGPTGTQYPNISMIDWMSSNSNYTQWNVNIKPGLMWSNGSLVTSQDILAMYSSTFGFSNQYDFTGIHNEVTSIVADNSSEATFNLNVSDAHFLETISPLVLTDVLPAADANGNYTGFGTTDVALGPFYAVGYTAGATQLVMLRNPYFYTTGYKEPTVCQLDVNFVETSSDASTYLLGGSTDFAYHIDPSSVATLIQHPNLHVLAESGIYPQSITWNVTAYPFNMTAFRQALVYGVNQSQILSIAFSGYGVTAWNAEGGVTPTVQNLYNPNQFQYSYNTTETTSLLQSIGIMKGSDGYYHYPNGTQVTLTLWADDSYSPDTLSAGIIQSSLQDLGFNVNLHLTNYGNLGSFTSLAPGTMYETSNLAPIYADPALDAEPGWNIFSWPAVPGQTYWEYPPNVNAQYEGNLSATKSTDNFTLLQQYEKNIQAISAQYLPAWTIVYGDELAVYNTDRFTNWGTYPTSWWEVNNNIDWGLLASIQPVGTNSTTTTTGGGQGTTTTSSSGSSAQSTSTQSSSSSASNGGSDYTLYYAIAAVAVIIVVIGGLVAFRMRRSPKS